MLSAEELFVAFTALATRNWEPCGFPPLVYNCIFLKALEERCFVSFFPLSCLKIIYLLINSYLYVRQRVETLLLLQEHVAVAGCVGGQKY